MSAGLAPAWVISQRPYGNSGRLVEFFTANQGRLSAVARGVHRKTAGGQPAQLLQVFYPLLIEVAGRSELKSLARLEPAGVALRPAGNAALCGMYLNELVLRLLPRFDPHPQLFASYGVTLEQLTAGVLEPALRRFEIQLLSELGYTINWLADARGNSLDPQQQYEFVPDQGFWPRGQPGGATVAGETLLEIARWLQSDGAALSSQSLRWARQLTRQAMAPLLGEKPLLTRELAQRLDWSVQQ